MVRAKRSVTDRARRAAGSLSTGRGRGSRPSTSRSMIVSQLSSRYWTSWSPTRALPGQVAGMIIGLSSLASQSTWITWHSR